MTNPVAKLLACFAALAGAGAVLHVINAKGFASEATAAWVQAVGTIAAVVFALHGIQSATSIATAQAREAREREAREIERNFAMAIDVVRAIHSRVDRMGKNLENKEKFHMAAQLRKLDIDPIRALRARVSGVPTYLMGNDQAISTFRLAEDLFERSVLIFDRALSLDFDHDDVSEYAGMLKTQAEIAEEHHVGLELCKRHAVANLLGTQVKDDDLFPDAQIE